MQNRSAWSNRTITKVYKWIEKDCSLQIIAGYLNLTRQAVHAGIKREPRLEEIWKSKQAIRNEKISKNKHNESFVRHKHYIRLYFTSYDDYKNLSDEEKRIRLNRIKKWRNLRKRAKHQGTNFNLPFNSIEWPTHCPVLGYLLDYNCKGYRRANSPSFDRINPSLGYIRGNVLIISMRANEIKTNASVGELLKVVEYIKTNRHPFYFNPQNIKIRTQPPCQIAAKSRT